MAPYNLQSLIYLTLDMWTILLRNCNLRLTSKNKLVRIANETMNLKQYTKNTTR